MAFTNKDKIDNKEFIQFTQNTSRKINEYAAALLGPSKTKKEFNDNMNKLIVYVALLKK